MEQAGIAAPVIDWQSQERRCMAEAGEASASSAARTRRLRSFQEGGRELTLVALFPVLTMRLAPFLDSEPLALAADAHRIALALFDECIGYRKLVACSTMR